MSAVDRMRRAVMAVLPPGATVEVRPARTTPTRRIHTARVAIRIGRATHRAVTGWAGTGWPADVQRLVEVAEPVDLVAAHDLSVGARDWLGERGIGWVDEIGRASIVLASGLVVVRDVAERQRRDVSESWSRSTVAVAESILCSVEPRVEAVQRATALSRGAAAKALLMLERRGYLYRDAHRGPGSARQVGDGRALLEAYAHAVADDLTRRRPILFRTRGGEPVESALPAVASGLGRLSADWSLTGVAAGALLAPDIPSWTILDWNVLELYVDEDTVSARARLCEELGIRQVDRDHQIQLRVLPNRITATGGRMIDGVTCAPPARVYADLVAKGGLAAEVAQHLGRVLELPERT